MLLNNTHRYREAEDLSRGALAQARRTLGPEHQATLYMAMVLARALIRQPGKAVEAEVLINGTLAIQHAQRVQGPGHPKAYVNTRMTYAQELQRGQT